MPGYFVNADYYATAAGKVFHDCCGTGSPSHFDFPRSWSDIPVLQTKFPCSDPVEGYTMSCAFNRSAGDAWPAGAVAVMRGAGAAAWRALEPRRAAPG